MTRVSPVLSLKNKPVIIDPLKFKRVFWPSVSFYKEQKEIIYSVRDNDMTTVPAGNGLGKDFVTAFIVLWFFCSRRPARVVTTSVNVGQLEDVLWGEMRNFIDNAKYKLPILYNHLKIRQLRGDGSIVPLAEIVGKVTVKGEGLLGRHLPWGPDRSPRTLVAFDEASGVDDIAFNSTDTWAHRRLVIGNPFPCENFFKRAVKKGDVKRPTGKGYSSRVIRISAEMSPNVRLAKAERRLGKAPSLDILVPGVTDYVTYCDRRQNWDKVRQCIGLDGNFYEGAEVLMYPPEWLNRAERIAAELAKSGKKRLGKSLGIDTAEGGDSTVWTVIDEFGIIEQVEMKTPNTAFIQGKTIEIAKRHGVHPTNWVFDAGGGGKEHADYLRAKGYDVRAVFFGESAKDVDQFKPVKPRSHKEEVAEEKTAYRNRRIEMYHLLRGLLNPENVKGFGIPAEMTELRRQLAVFPIQYAEDGQLTLPPKSKRDSKDQRVTLTDMIGRSPDNADSLVLAVYGLLKKPTRTIAGAL
jgi:hypothetical protein